MMRKNERGRGSKEMVDLLHSPSRAGERVCEADLEQMSHVASIKKGIEKEIINKMVDVIGLVRMIDVIFWGAAE
jgi:uncharacterized protein (DUF342 family)